MNDDRLRHLLDTSFGEGPTPPPPATRLVPARRALRRRRLASGGAGAAVLAVAVTVFALVGGSGSGSRAADPAAPTTTAPAEPPRPTNDNDVDLAPDGTLLTVEGVTVLETIDDPLGSVAPDHSLGVAYRLDGEETWAFLVSTPDGSNVSTDPARKSFATLQRWVDDQVALETGGPGLRLVSFRDDTSETLRSRDGVLIVEQSGDVDIPRFAGPEDRSAVALVELDDRRWFVLARDVGGPPEYFPTAGSVGGRTVADFLDYAADQYAGGEGLR